MRSTAMWLSCAAHVAVGAASAAWLALTRGALVSLPQTATGGRLLASDESARLSTTSLGQPLEQSAGLLASAGTRYWLGLVAALLTAGLTVRATRMLVEHTRWARALHLSLRVSLLGARPAHMALLAASSACAEELFFRALLGPAVGFVVSAALFGALHGLRREGRLPVALWSFGMALVFSELYLASGTLLAPVLAHCVINYENMQYICNYDPTPLDIDRFPVSGESGSGG